ncbi:MAG: SH3 domain-containing protein [Lachnospiraceae bacterium]|nr:SH3 domain-containing protein [Lachnospiraceae bacterium]
MSTKSICKQGRSFLTILLMLALFLTPLGPGLRSQAARATGTVKNRILNVRSSASTSSSIVCKLTQGTKVTILSDTTGDDGLKWYNVYFAYNGDAKEGYVRADLVNVSGAVLGSSSGGNTSSNTPAGSGSTRYVKPPVAIIRTYASTNADIRSRLEKGSSVTVLSSKTGSDDGRTWYKISFTKNGSAMDGYIRGDLLVDTNPGGTGSTSTDVSGTRYINTDSARIRTYASPNADIRSGLPRGTQVTLISSKTGDDGSVWYKISYTENGSRLTGYVRSDLLSSDKPGSDSSGGSSGGAANTPATVKPAVANIRTYASTSGDIRSKLPAGTSVTILSETTGSDGRKWYQISYTYNGSALKGYIRSDLVTLGGTTGGSSSLGNSSGSNSNNNSSAVAEVRTYASPYADIRATLANGSKVTILKEVTGEDGQKWTKISFTQDNKKIEGYIPSSIIK